MPVTEQLPISGTIAVKYNLCGIYPILFKISRVGILASLEKQSQKKQEKKYTPIFHCMIRNGY